MSDRLALAHVIEDAGIPREKAEAVATAIARFVEGSAATKADVQATEAVLKADIAHAATTLRVEMGALKADSARLEGRIDRVEHRLMTRLGGLMVVLAGILFAALHMWPPH
jgi:hypothetical protein